jgi:hypothetical protein
MLSLGLDVSRHQDVLATFEETQRLHTEHVKQLKQELINPRGHNRQDRR